MLEKVSPSLSFEHDVRTLFVDTSGIRAGERERQRVPDCSNSSSDEDTSDDDGEQQSDGVSEAQITPYHGFNPVTKIFLYTG